MRVIIVFLLLILNGSFLLWQFYRPVAEPPQWTAVEPGVEPLRLASEAASPSGGDVSANLAANAARPPAPDARRPARGDTEAEAATAAAGQEQRRRDRTRAPDALSCGAIGPFYELAGASQVVDQLKGFGLQARVGQGEEPDNRYWVFLPPFESRRAAFVAVADLRARGVKDIQLLGGDHKENGVSLGLFKEQGSARRRIEQITAMGYRPEMETLRRSRAAYWAEYTAVGGRDLTQEQRADLLRADSRARVEPRSCR